MIISYLPGTIISIGIHVQFCSDGDLRNLIVLEQFKNSIPEHVTIYMSENRVKMAAEAAASADE